MFYALIWSVMIPLLALLSLAALAFNSIAAWIVSNAAVLAGGLSVAVWAAWGVGSALIVILGLTCSRLVTVLRRRTSVAFAPFVAPMARD